MMEVNRSHGVELSLATSFCLFAQSRLSFEEDGFSPSAKRLRFDPERLVERSMKAGVGRFD